jgi:Tfp pilus assembly protein PilZ
MEAFAETAGVFIAGDPLVKIGEDIFLGLPVELAKFL